MALRRLIGVVAAALAFLALAVTATPAVAEPNFPEFSGLVVDAANVLSDPDKAELTRELRALQDKTGIQFAVATVPSLDGEEIEPYANELFRKWKIGRKDLNDGLLLILAPKEHKLRFEVGYGLEGTMTDAQSKLILRNTMVPRLKAGDPAGALKAGVDDAIKVLSGDKSVARPVAQNGGQLDSDTIATIAIIIIVAMFVLYGIIVPAMRRRRGAGSGWVVGTGAGSSASSWSSSDSSSSGGDSFGGGGGGDSGGGGSSDSY